MSSPHEQKPTAEIHEFEFPNTLTGRVRGWIHGLAGKWSLRHTIQQQNEINRAQQVGQDLIKQSVQQIDKDGVETRRQVGELTALVAQLNRKIDELESELNAKE